MRNARNIIRHEFIGLSCEVVKANNKSSVGIKGTVRDETMKTMIIDDKRVAKKGSVFRLRLPKNVVEVEGDTIIVRPEDRIKKKFRKW